ncbi:crotonase/enoyl-CoA hydratase family protein [Pseudooceanicola sp. MF1-13]|uniref:crotonase/enoyl-CoA hydratase family protein n=1 Tax=Pseudooceanicola sp. MF1-13 TaxID=3379095 RepID=UPI0038922DEF
MSDSEIVLYELDGDVAIITLNRPEKRNAVSDRVINALGEAVDRAQVEAKAAVICGAGKHFCAGLDLAEHVKRSPIDGMHHSRGWHAVFDRIESGKIPFFSALHGAVVGGGLELATATHIRVADATTFFALPEGTRGIFVGGGASVRVGRLAGVARMTDMMLTGRTVSAEEGERWNLCQYVVGEGEAKAFAIDLARKAAQNAEMSNYAILHALPRMGDMSRSDGLFLESFVASLASSSPEAEERLNAFLNKTAARLAHPSK